MTVGSEGGGAPLDIVEPVAAATLGAEPILAERARVDGGARDADAMVTARRELDGGALRNCRRQHEAAVVVGVLADEVDSSGRVGGDRRRTAEERREIVHGSRPPSFGGTTDARG